jgi:hypothetical protein
MPVIRAIVPFHFRETVDGVERGELGLARPLNAGVVDSGGLVLLRLLRADGDSDGDGCLDRKYILALACTASLAAEIENPDFVALATHVLAHPAEGVSVEVARRADETDNARPTRRPVFENLPQRPTPEVDIEVVEILDVDAVAGGDGRVEKIAEDGVRAFFTVAPADPAAGSRACSQNKHIILILQIFLESPQSRNHRQFNGLSEFVNTP